PAAWGWNPRPQRVDRTMRRRARGPPPIRDEGGRHQLATRASLVRHALERAEVEHDDLLTAEAQDPVALHAIERARDFLANRTQSCRDGVHVELTRDDAGLALLGAVADGQGEQEGCEAALDRTQREVQDEV